MAPSCIVDPMECILLTRALRKRAPPPPPAVIPPTTDNGIGPHEQMDSEDTEHVLVIIAAVLGSILLILSLILFYICMKRRRASRRIGQLQEFLPTFMDQEKTESYFKHATSTSSASSSPTTPSNVHHRTRSAPIAFAKGGKGVTQLNRNRDRDGSNGGNFQQIPLVPEETSFVDSEEEAAMKKSLSTPMVGPTRTRATTVSVPPSATVSSLHRSVSLNHRSSTDHSSRTPHTDSDFIQDPHDDDALPTGLRFAEGEMLPVSNSSSNASITRSGGYTSSSNRYSVSMEFNNLPGPSRFSSTSHLTHSMDFDPTRFSTTSVMFDAKRLSILSGGEEEGEGERGHEDDDAMSSGDDFDHLPAHQKPQNFESHTMMLPQEDLEDEFYAQEHILRSSPSTIRSAPVSKTHELQLQGAR
ncbi:MAG: hypothetical protein BYD32DRAFT_417522 [Podila humilis]|nr:MAG: hypothetical protein BYD32DRAFT_417522 [Podila humilis]